MNKYGATPLHYASTWLNGTCLSTIVAAGADINVQDEDGKTPLDWTPERIKQSCIDMLKAHLPK